MHIDLVRADITSLRSDAIVNPTSAQLVPGAEAGTATVTTGGNLLCKYVINAVVPRLGDGDEDAKLRRATLASLERAEELFLESIAFPPMSTGVFGFSYERCARIMLSAAIDFGSRALSVRRVIFAVFGEDAYNEFDRVLRSLRT
jgi:O-acetyl-ADP-ribose deacetylase (regulator of RNase III)